LRISAQHADPDAAMRLAGAVVDVFIGQTKQEKPAGTAARSTTSGD
jgi:hypothetical protein